MAEAQVATLAGIAPELPRELDALVAACPFDVAGVEEGCRAVEGLARRLLAGAFEQAGAWQARARSAGVGQAEGGEHSVAAIVRELGIARSYESLFQVLLEMLARDGTLSLEGDRLTARATRDTSPAAYAQLREEVLARHPDRAILLRLVEACAPRALDVATGQVGAVELLFPGGDQQMVLDVYASDAVSAFFNVLTAAAVAGVVGAQSRGRADQPVAVLEIGAGTGGTSALVLERLASHRIVYDFTDLSSGLLQTASASLGAAHPEARFRVLDIGRDPRPQGFGLGGYDVALAANVLHATPSIATTLAHTAALLRPGGVLVLNEVTRVQDFTTLTFGLTPGWWLFEDADVRIPGSPLLSATGWRRALANAGFADVHAFTPFVGDPDQPHQSLFVAVKAGAPAAATGNATVRNLVRMQLDVIARQLDALGARQVAGRQRSGR